jgi:simple sugar transport system permease protein
MGAIFGGGFALAFPDLPAALLFPGMLIAAILGGLFWAGIVVVLKIRFNTSEILTSLMLTYVAQLLLIYLVSGPWRDPAGYGFPQTAMFSESATAPMLLEGTRVHLGVALSLVVVLVAWLLLSHSIFGFQLRVQGAAPRAARFAGFSQARIIAMSLLISGGLAGLAGIFEVAGPIGQLTPVISPGYGFTAIIVAFLGRLHPAGVLLAGLLLALSYLGGEAAQIELALPSAVTGIFQGILLFFLLACDTLILYRFRFGRGSAMVASRAPAS